MILSIDQGTTGTTVLVFDRRARVVARAYAELPQHYPKPGWVEHDPREIIRVTERVIAQVLSGARLSAKKIQAIGITNQRETAMLWDRRSGHPIANAIVWQCRRSAPLCDRLRRGGHETQIKRRTGLLLDAYFSGTKIRWLLDHVRGAKQAAQRGNLAFGTVDTWLLWWLTGGRSHATDYTNASRTLLYNIRQLRWDKHLLALFGVPKAVLPEVKSSSGLFGTTRRGHVLPSGIPIMGIAGDQQASMVGHGCLRRASAKNTYGTGCFLLLNTGSRVVTSRHGLVSTLVYSGEGLPAYALEGSIFIAGAAVQWLRDGLRLIRSAPETEAIARSVKDTGGVYVVPAFVGLGAPYWDMEARGAIVGLTRGTTREVIVRSTLESLAYQTRDVVESMQRDSGMRFKKLQVDGGAAQNDWLMQFQSDILGIPVLRPSMAANTARGAAFLAGIGIGWWTPQRAALLAGLPAQTFLPRMSATKRNRLYAGWQQALRHVSTKRSRCIS